MNHDCPNPCPEERSGGTLGLFFESGMSPTKFSKLPWGSFKIFSKKKKEKKSPGTICLKIFRGKKSPGTFSQKIF